MSTEKILNVILDTEVFKRDPWRKKGPFLALNNLAKSGKIKIHIPEISVREFLSDQQSRVKTVFETSKSSFNSLIKFPVPQQLIKILDDLSNSFEQAEQDTFNEIRQSFEQWCEEHNVMIETVQKDHATKMLDAYFSGSPPFKKIKNREDMPDAFIWASVSDICEKQIEVILITGDNNLRAACSKGFKNLTGFSAIEEFLEKKGFIADLRQSILETQLSIVYEYILSKIFSSDLVRDIIEKDLIDRNIVVFYPFRGTFQISTLSKSLKLLLDDNATYYGDGLLSIPFSARAICDLKHITEKSNLKSIRNTDSISIIELDNEFVELRLSRTIVFAGSILFGIEASLFQEDKPYQEIIKRLETTETVLEYISIHGEKDSKVSVDLFNKHAHNEALEQIENGNLDIQIDDDEEKNRLDLARWFELPKNMIGKHDELEIKEGAKVKIAPIPRFEEWVKILKKGILNKKESE